MTSYSCPFPLLLMLKQCSHFGIGAIFWQIDGFLIGKSIKIYWKTYQYIQSECFQMKEGERGRRVEGPDAMVTFHRKTSAKTKIHHIMRYTELVLPENIKTPYVLQTRMHIPNHGTLVIWNKNINVEDLQKLLTSVGTILLH